MNTTSNDAEAPAVPPELDRLELSLRRLIDDHTQWKRRAAQAETRVRELEAALDDVASGELDPVALAAHAKAVERENRGLRKRLADARETVERIRARLQFLEEER
jgi:predicted RNase H-like nuclease (RuvC/YqgF family)